MGRMIFTQAVHIGKGWRQVRLRCPACKHRAALEALGGQDHEVRTGQGTYYFGQRRCPNPDCLAHLFIVRNRDNAFVSYPPERIDFDATDVPDEVTNALEEAITCHANNCYIAAAIMVRKTLEEVCRERGATGKTLNARIKALGGKVILPQPMLDGLDDLRLLGNDAAHIESQDYNQVGKEEVEVAIDLTKEILKSTYQYESIMGRLDALKKTQDANGSA